MRLSVALCTYNGRLYIEQQLDSIAGQELPVDEIVVCDDNSSDETVSIVELFSLKHSEISIKIYRNNSQLGVIKNFEKAISLCSGDIIFCSDQDDIWMPQKTSIFINTFNADNKLDLIFSNAFLIDSNNFLFSGYTLFDIWGLKGNILKAWKKNMYFEIMNKGNRITGATVAFRKTFADCVLPFKRTDILHDEQLAIQAIKRNSLGMIEDCLTKYRIHSSNVCGIGDYSPTTEFPSVKNCIKSICVPTPIRTCLEEELKSIRVNFYRKRIKFIKMKCGILFQTIYLFRYIQFYRIFFPYFYVSDIKCNLKEILHS